MQTIGKLSFVLAPIFLILSFLCGAFFEGDALRFPLLVLGTVFLILALAAKAGQARKEAEEDER